MQDNGHRFAGTNKLLVTEEKLLLFLKEAVVGRDRRHCGKKRALSEQDEEEEEEADDDGRIGEADGPVPRQQRQNKVGIQTYRNYVNAVVSIWKHQTMMKVCSLVSLPV
jgi:hypothetical protein